MCGIVMCGGDVGGVVAGGGGEVPPNVVCDVEPPDDVGVAPWPELYVRVVCEPFPLLYKLR